MAPEMFAGGQVPGMAGMQAMPFERRQLESRPAAMPEGSGKPGRQRLRSSPQSKSPHDKVGDIQTANNIAQTRPSQEMSSATVIEKHGLLTTPNVEHSNIYTEKVDVYAYVSTLNSFLRRAYTCSQ